MSESIGHNDEFYDNFRFLLRLAIKNDIYNKKDYINNPQKYCGIKIQENIFK